MISKDFKNTTFGELMNDCSKIFKKYSAELLMIAYSFTKDLDIARDAVSECFVKLLEHEIVLERSEDEIKAWLIVVVKNHCLDFNRTSSNRNLILSFLNFDYLTENKWYEKVEKDSVQKLINLLSTKEAEVFNLHLEGYTNDEIKEKLSVSYSTVKNQLYEAKKKLRKIWEITGGLIVLWILK